MRRSTAASAPESNGTPQLCAFLSHSLGAEFVTIRTYCSTGASDASGPDVRFTLQRGACIPAPPNDLVDFELDTQRLWALWCNAHGDFNVASYPLHANASGNHGSADAAGVLCWQTAILEPIVEPVHAIDATADPKETFCSHIFHPGRFQRDVIAKALVMFGHNSTSSSSVGTAAATAAVYGLQSSNAAATANCSFSNSTAAAEAAATLSVQVLRDRVCTAIDLEVAADVAGFEAAQVQPLSDEDVLEVSHTQWERFYAGVEQYHVKMRQPIGVFGLRSVGGVCVVRKRSVSLLRPCELLEHLMMQENGGSGINGNDAIDAMDCGGGAGDAYESADVRVVRSILSVDIAAAADLVRLVRILATLEGQLGDHVKRDVHERLYQLHMPNVVVGELLANDDAADADEAIFTRDFVQALQNEVRSIGDLRAAMHMLLETLRMDEDEQMVQYSE